MIHLPYNGTSSVILRLTKVATILDPFYTFELINQQSKEITIFTADNISPVKLIYDEFNLISSTSSFGATSGTLNNYPGVYTYNIYETEYEYNLDLGSASFLRSGELVISATNDFNPSVYTQSNALVTSVYNIRKYQ